MLIRELKIPYGHLLIANGLHDRALGSLIQRIQPGHIIAIKLEPIHIGVTRNPRWRIALRQRYKALLQTPAHKHLVRAHAVLLADTEQRRVVRFFVAHERTVGFDYNVVLLAICYCVALLAPGVQLGMLSTYIVP
jgi:hypothetical protein